MYNRSWRDKRIYSINHRHGAEPPFCSWFPRFPLYLYDTDEIEADSSTEDSLFVTAKPKKSESERKRRDAITDAGLAHFQEKYLEEKITKEDLFYYIYGLLHTPKYREKYADSLSKELPCIQP
nr:type ISP restriction/modification enzyme [Leptospira borgpetersenii]